MSTAEYIAILRCAGQLENTLQSDRNIVHYLRRENFIPEDVYEDVLNPNSMLSAASKASELIYQVRLRVKKNTKHFHTFMDYLYQDRETYATLIKPLDDTYLSVSKAINEAAVVNYSEIATSPSSSCELDEFEMIASELDMSDPDSTTTELSLSATSTSTNTISSPVISTAPQLSASTSSEGSQGSTTSSQGSTTSYGVSTTLSEGFTTLSESSTTSSEILPSTAGLLVSGSSSTFETPSSEVSSSTFDETGEARNNKRLKVEAMDTKQLKGIFIIAIVDKGYIGGYNYNS